MRLSFLIILVTALSVSVTAQQDPQVTSAKTDITKSTVRPYNEVITGKTITKKGLFTIHQNNDKYYFEIPDSLLGRELLLTTWLVKVPGGSPKFGGEIMNNMTIMFDKERNNKIGISRITTITQSDTANVISKAVKNSNLKTAAVVCDVKARGNSGNTSVIDVTDFLQKENMFTAVNAEVKNAMTLTSIAADRSSVKSFASYPINMELKLFRTYNASTTPPKPLPGRPPVVQLEAARLGGAVTLEISVSILLMPEKPMMARRFDPRVGYFADGFYDITDNQQKMDPKIFIVRYRLEPKPADMERYKRGELVEPKNPIVYYVDPATPKQWRPYIIAGINDWNEAFKAAGFKNAIIGKEWPENDTTMSLEDARYKIIRYFPSEVANAYGPNIHDPRSGEILQSYVGWYHNVMKLLHDWYMIQASPNDPHARKMKFSDTLMGTLIRFVSSHEVGHTLGLRHNMGSSSTTPVEKLRDKKWVEAHGHTNSIMDYARFNYVAQPEDSIGEAGIMPRINDYDKWAIKWGYTYLGEEDDMNDKKIVSQWIVDSLQANPRLWFGGEGLNFDARCQREDIGDNSMKASEYGIKNLKYVMAHLTEWTKEDNDLYTNMLDIYRQVASQYSRYVTHVGENIASVYETIRSVEQPGDTYTRSPKEKQKEAVIFLQKEVFTTPQWLLDNEILNKISNPVRVGSVSAAQTRVLDQILSNRVLNTMLMTEQRFGKEGTYTLIEFIDDVKAGVWSELKTGRSIDIYRRSLQKNYIQNMLASIKEAKENNNVLGILFGVPEENLPIIQTSDIGSYLAFHLNKLRQEILKTIPLIKDKESRDHLVYVADQIKTGIEKLY